MEFGVIPTGVASYTPMVLEHSHRVSSQIQSQNAPSQRLLKHIRNLYLHQNSITDGFK